MDHNPGPVTRIQGDPAFDRSGIGRSDRLRGFTLEWQMTVPEGNEAIDLQPSVRADMKELSRICGQGQD